MLSEWFLKTDVVPGQGRIFHGDRCGMESIEIGFGGDNQWVNMCYMA